MSQTHGLPYNPVEQIPPGETLLEWLEKSDMSQAEFAKRSGLTPKHINQVVKGGASISPEVAIAFERVTSIGAQFWTQLEANYQTALQRQVEEQELERDLHLLQVFPIAELVKRKAIAPKSSKIEQLRELLRFFGVANAAALERVWAQPTLFRKSKAFDADDAALASWLRLAEVGAPKTRPFDAALCRASLDQMRRLSALPAMDWWEPLQALCADVGIAAVILKEFRGCRVNGATRWLPGDRALIALSFRHLRNDIFWFTFFHEVCHVLRHGKKETFIEGAGQVNPDQLESEADAFAAKTLIPPHRAVELESINTVEQLVDFADDLGIAPAIVVGRMQHEKLIPYKQWQEFFERYEFVANG